jgi:hypothetical protein
MKEQGMSASSWVQLLQALVARELVEELGIPSHQAAQLLGLAPSAISQYLSGKRLAGPFLRYSTDEGARRVARQVAERLSRTPAGDEQRTRILLEGSLHLSGSSGEGSEVPGPAFAGLEGGEGSRLVAKWLRHRVRAEQAAVTACMHLAQKARDELTRAIFRQIASDSLRHAEIVASLATYLDRGVVGAYASGVTRREVELMIQAERRAEAQAGTDLASRLGGTMSMLVASMEADERKHAELLQGLLATGFDESREKKREVGPVRAPATRRSRS